MGAKAHDRYAGVHQFELGETYRISYTDPHLVWEQGLTDSPPDMRVTLTGDCVYLDEDLVALAAERLPDSQRCVTYLPRCLVRSVVRLEEVP